MMFTTTGQIRQNNYGEDSMPGQNKLRVTTIDQVYFIDTADILRIESISNYSKIFFTNGKTILVSKVLAHFEMLLTDFHFVRIHRTHLVNMLYIRNYERGSLPKIGLHNNERLPVSRSKKKLLQYELKKYCLA